MSNIRLIAQFWQGTEHQTVDVIAPDALDALIGVTDSPDKRLQITRALGRPNDVHRALTVEYGWWNITQVWSYDQRAASEILSDAMRHDVPTRGVDQTKVHARSCGYGCMCGAFPSDADYCQNLATDG